MRNKILHIIYLSISTGWLLLAKRKMIQFHSEDFKNGIPIMILRYKLMTIAVFQNLSVKYVTQMPRK